MSLLFTMSGSIRNRALWQQHRKTGSLLDGAQASRRAPFSCSSPRRQVEPARVLPEGQAQTEKVRLAEPNLRDSEVWWSQTGSNRRPEACKATALPTELWPLFQGNRSHRLRMVGPERFELSTPRLSSVCSNQLSYGPAPLDADRRPEAIRYGTRPRRKRNEDGGLLRQVWISSHIRREDM